MLNPIDRRRMPVEPPSYELGPEQQLCFLHIPKTGGVSLAAVLRQQFGRSKVTDVLTPPDLAAKANSLGDYKVISGHFFFAQLAVFPRMPSVITMLRDPIERSISQFEQLRRHAWEDPDFAARMRNISLEELMDDPRLRGHVTNLQTRYLASAFEPEIGRPSDILSSREKIESIDLEVAKNRLQEMPFFGVCDRFEDSLALLACSFGWRSTPFTPALNMAPSRIARNELQASTLQRLSELNDIDLTLYTWASELFELRMRGFRIALLDLNFIQRYRLRNVPNLKSVEYRFDEPIPGVGWHFPEVVGSDTWCWTGPEILSTLDFPLAADRDLQVEIAAKFAIDVDTLMEFAFAVNGSLVPLTMKRVPAGGVLYEGVVPSEAIRRSEGFARLSFQVKETKFPKGIDPSDPGARRLGIALEYVRLWPASPSGSVSDSG